MARIYMTINSMPVLARLDRRERGAAYIQARRRADQRVPSLRRFVELRSAAQFKTLRSIRSLLLIVGTCSSVACGPYIGTCGWLDLADNAGMRVVAPRAAVAGECDCLRCAAPGQFQMHRPAYVLEFWNGDRWYPELLARARTNDGRRLALQSDQLRSLAGSTVSGKWKEFDYYSAAVFNEVGNSTVTFRFPERLNITVLDEHGRALGTEVIVLRLETRRHIAFEGI